MREQKRIGRRCGMQGRLCGSFSCHSLLFCTRRCRPQTSSCSWSFLLFFLFWLFGAGSPFGGFGNHMSVGRYTSAQNYALWDARAHSAQAILCSIRRTNLGRAERTKGYLHGRRRAHCTARSQHAMRVYIRASPSQPQNMLQSDGRYEWARTHLFCASTAASTMLVHTRRPSRLVSNRTPRVCALYS